MWGSSPAFFFLQPPMSVDTLLAPIRDHIAGLGFELVDLRHVGTLQRPILQVRVDRPDSRPGQGITADDSRNQPVPRAIPRIERDGRAAVRAGGVLTRHRTAAALARDWRGFVGRRARVRARALGGGRREVEIVGVPDEEHVTVRMDGGPEVTVPLAAIRDARLVMA